MTLHSTTPPPSAADARYQDARAASARRLATHTTNATNGSRDNSLVGLIRELRDDTVTLLRQEVALIRAEIQEKVEQTARDAVTVAIGGVAAYVGGLLLLVGVCLLGGYGLTEAGLHPLLASFISFAVIGSALAVGGYLFLRKALTRLSGKDIKPNHSVDSLRETAQWVKEKTS